jgi:vacuolar-type H+-ATPase subunit E/Vma4
MNSKLFNPLLILLILVTPTFWGTSLRADDMREVQIQAQETKRALMQRAAEEKAAADKAAAQSRAQIMADRSTLQKAIAGLESSVRILEKEVLDLTAENSRLEEKEKALNEALTQTGGAIKELVGTIRVNAKDIDGLIRQNLQTALDGTPDAFLEAVARESRFPAMGDHGIHDLDLPVGNQHSPSHEFYRFGLIHNFSDTGDVLQGGWDQFAGAIIENKRRRSPHAKAVGGNPIVVPARCTGQGLLNQRSEHMKMTGGFIVGRQSGICQQVLNLRRRAGHTDLFKDAQRILMNRAQHLPGIRASGHMA